MFKAHTWATSTLILPFKLWNSDRISYSSSHSFPTFLLSICLFPFYLLSLRDYFLLFSLSSLSVFLSIFICIFIMLTATNKTLKWCADAAIMTSWQATLVMITTVMIVWFYAVFITYTRGLLCFTQIEVLSGEQRRAICLCLFSVFSFTICLSFLQILWLSLTFLALPLCCLYIYPSIAFLSLFFLFFSFPVLSLSSFCLTLNISLQILRASSPPPRPFVSVLWLVACGRIC